MSILTRNVLGVVENVVEVELEAGSFHRFTMSSLVCFDMSVVVSFEGLVEVLEEVVVVEAIVLMVVVGVGVARHVIGSTLLRIGEHLVGYENEST